MNFVTLVRSYLLFACFIVLPSCASQRSGLKEEKPQTCLDNEFEHKLVADLEVAQAPWLTVWIHGTQPSFDNAPGKRLRAALKKRAHEVFYCASGLHHISTQPKTNRHYEFARLLHEVDSVRFSAEHFYTFGWSGDLSFDVRHKAGQELYQELAGLAQEFTHTHGVRPNIRLITHSHGGNVALNLALAHAEHRKDLVINQLVLLACPVQEKTAFLAQDTLFKKIYSLYSSLDIIQRIDPQGLYKNNSMDDGLFSKRRFPDSYHNIAQAKIRFNKRAILHIEFLSDQFVRALPHIITKLDTWDQSSDDYRNIKQICIQKDTGSLSDLRCSYAHQRSTKHKLS